MATQTPTEQFAPKIRRRYIIGILILIPVLAHLFYAVSRSPLTNYYVTVDELVARERPAGKVRVGGDVVSGSINWNNASRTLEFHVESQGKHLPVNYRGFAPDAFRDGATAIVEGELARNGTFIAYSVLVKCPHRYVPL